ncbi:cytidine deaminase-like protein [Calycina marina]|uniref:Cytidine deaminase n=1 Tax=Calycina marina TaxID=1763456 RepID=A0A9P7Z4Q2_9HELO|nr:cytidine deaminase-like protein [Calycina marina]
MSTSIQQSSDASIVSQICDTYKLTIAEFNTLRERSSAAKATAYCPYSQFRVGATLLAGDGSYIDGANVENASYPVGTCAERVAFGKAVTEGKKGFRAVAVATDISPPASPCGMCRQFIREFCDLSTPIIMFDKDQAFVVLRLEQVCTLLVPVYLPSTDSYTWLAHEAYNARSHHESRLSG